VIFNFVVVGWYLRLGGDLSLAKYVAGIKVVSVWTFILSGVLSLRGLRRYGSLDVLFFFWVFVSIMFGLTSPIPPILVLVQTINHFVATFFVFYCLYEFCRTYPKEFFATFYPVIAFVLFVAAIGVLVHVDPWFMYVDLFSFDYGYVIRGDTDVGEIPNALLTKDFGIVRLRNASVIGDAIITAYYFACSVVVLICYVFERKNSSFGFLVLFGLIAVFFIVIYLTHSKGGVLFISFFLILMMIRKEWVFIVVFMLLLSAEIFISLSSPTSAAIHVLGFLEVFNQNIKSILIGNGIGTGGNAPYAMGLLDKSNWLKTGAESAAGSIIYQSGLIGYIMFVVLLLRKYTGLSFKKYGLNYARAFIVAWILIGILQENMVSPSYALIFAWAICQILLFAKSGIRRSMVR
jgi:hypothetical protein